MWYSTYPIGIFLYCMNKQGITNFNLWQTVIETTLCLKQHKCLESNCPFGCKIVNLRPVTSADQKIGKKTSIRLSISTILGNKWAKSFPFHLPFMDSFRLVRVYLPPASTTQNSGCLSIMTPLKMSKAKNLICYSHSYIEWCYFCILSVCFICQKYYLNWSYLE